MPATFVFFHVGPDTDQPSMLVRSIQRTNPGALIIQCSDAATAKIDGVTQIERSAGNPQNLMTDRLSAFATLGLSKPALYLDTDMLVLQPIDPEALLGEREVMMCRRDFDCSLPHSGAMRGVEFPEHRGRPLGEVYPYVACATISRNADFWASLLDIIHTLDERFHRWYGDQEAMRIWAERHDDDTLGKLPEAEYGCLPEKSESLKTARIVHFKGHARKPVMAQTFKLLFDTTQPASGDVATQPIAPESNVCYVIMTPPPNPKSAGITYLNALAGYLRDIGKNVIQLYAIYPNEELHVWGDMNVPSHNHWRTPWQGHWIKCSPGQLFKTLDGRRTIVIHGENQHRKWFEGLNVVRYYLNTIGAMQKKGVPRDDEFKLAWHPSFCEQPDHILWKSTFRGDPRAASTLPIEGRSIDLSYIGKASIHLENLSRIPGTLELTRSWPANDDEYFYLLSKTRFLFTFDAVTSVMDDAIIMGAFPVIMTTAPKTREHFMLTVDPELAGSFSFIDDDYHQALKNFPEGRANFLQYTIKKDMDYFESLRDFCEKAERRFFG